MAKARTRKKTLSAQTKLDILRKLYEHGWIQVKRPTEPQLREAIRSYQNFHGLVPDGEPSPAVERSLEAWRFCGLPDFLILDASQSKWPQLDVTYGIIKYLPGISQESQRAATVQGCNYWNAVCGIRMAYTANPRTANIQIEVMSQAPGGVLAQSELPMGANPTRCKQWYDDKESWVLAEDPKVQEIDLVRVVCHEIGHAIGIGHIQSGNLLAPMYSRQIRSPQAGDIAEAVARYGQATTPPPPDGGGGAPVPTPDTCKVQVAVGGKMGSATIPLQ